MVLGGGWSLFLFLYYVGILIKPISFLSSFIVVIIAFSMLVIVHHFFFILILEYLISSLVVTTKQIIELKFVPFVTDDLIFIEIDQIHEIEKRKHGFLRNIFNYGDVVIEFLGSTVPIDFHFIGKPRKFVDLIESIKYGKPLEDLDLSGCGITCAKKYDFLAKKPALPQ